MSVTVYNTCSIFTYVIFGLTLLWKMQGVTSDWNFETKVGVIKFIHRFALCSVSIFMVFKAMWSIENNTGPRAIDLISECLLMTALVISTIRHRLAINLDNYLKQVSGHALDR